MFRWGHRYETYSNNLVAIVVCRQPFHVSGSYIYSVN